MKRNCPSGHLGYKVRYIDMTPREKKDRDLTNHCKNRYGNSDKAARKGVRRKKRTSTHRARREGNHAVAQVLAAPDPDEVEIALKADPSPGSMRKSPDVPMGEVLLWKIRLKIRGLLAKQVDHLDYIGAFGEWCRGDRAVNEIRAAAWERYLRAMDSGGVGIVPKMSAEDLRDLHDALVEFRRGAVL